MSASALEIQIRGILHVVDSVGRNRPPSQQMLNSIREMAVDALAIIQSPDPEVQRLGTAVLVVKRCTEVRKRRNSDEKYTVIKNRAVLDWAIEEIHQLKQDVA